MDKEFHLDTDHFVMPETVSELQALVKRLFEHIAKRDAVIESQQAQIHQLQRIVFGRRSEKMQRKQEADEEAQDHPGDLEAGAPSGTGPKTPSNKGHHSTGRQRRDNLPRERVEYDLLNSEKVCSCGSPLCKIGEEITEQLEYCPASFKIIEHVRFKYGCMTCAEGVTLAPLPPQPIDKGLAGPGLLAHILVSKYTDYQPLYRLEKIFKRHGVTIARSTQCGWVGACAQLLKPIYLGMKDEAVTAPQIHTDDTPAPTLKPGLGRTLTGRMWIYIACFLNGLRIVIYDYKTDRSSEGPLAFLKRFVGYLQADAYAGYDACYKLYKIIEIACWAHARRKFYEISKRIKKPGIAHQAVEFIGKLYAIEKKARDMSHEERKQIRQIESAPILEEFKGWLDTQKAIVPPAGALGQAIQYVLNHWVAFNNYLLEGWLNIDNNLGERGMRVIAMGRKNYMFFGSEVGGENAAIICSLIETCILNGVEPFEYLRDVLTRLPTHLNKDLAELFPYNWKVLQEERLKAKAA